MFSLIRNKDPQGDYIMNTLIKAILLTGAMASPAFAQNAAPSGGQSMGSGMTGPGNHTMNSGMMGAAGRQSMGSSKRQGMMNGGMMKHMSTMHQHMQQMQALMTEIRSEKDPAKRRALMQQHMTSMQAMMRSLHASMAQEQKMPMGNSMGAMQQRMKMMQQHMSMMQMMMGQMIDHSAEQQRKGMHGGNS